MFRPCLPKRIGAGDCEHIPPSLKWQRRKPRSSRLDRSHSRLPPLPQHPLHCRCRRELNQRVQSRNQVGVRARLLLGPAPAVVSPTSGYSLASLPRPQGQ